MSRRDRDFDIIIFGATGFTGRLVAEYMCRNYGIDQQFRWTIAGRNRDKLAALRAKLVELDPKAISLPLVVADSFDEAALTELAGRCEVVCTTVGPYAQYGAELVRACVAMQTDYCDLCGESTFIREMIDAHHESAKATGTRIVHACGYDSIPSDLGVLYAQQAFHHHFGRCASEIRFFTGKTSGGISGGTIASMAGLLERASDPAVRRILGNPYALNPKDGVRGLDGQDQRTLRFDSRAARWTAPFMMAGVNTRVVRRSHSILGYPYGHHFRYSEVMGFKKGLRGWWQATRVTGFLAFFVTMMLWGPTRQLLRQTLLPAPGQGPDQQKRENGYFRVHLMALDAQDECWVTVGDDLDPGYSSTAKMLAESAIGLVCQHSQLEGRGGVLTPATALGSV